MDIAKRERLLAQGWQFGDAADFLELTPEEGLMVKIRSASIDDEDLLTNLNSAELQALAGVALSTEKQLELSELLARNQENQLSVEEIETLDRLLEQIDQLNLLKARAQYTLQYILH